MCSSYRDTNIACNVFLFAQNWHVIHIQFEPEPSRRSAFHTLLSQMSDNDIYAEGPRSIRKPMWNSFKDHFSFLALLTCSLKWDVSTEATCWDCAWALGAVAFLCGDIVARWPCFCKSIIPRRIMPEYSIQDITYTMQGTWQVVYLGNRLFLGEIDGNQHCFSGKTP